MKDIRKEEKRKYRNILLIVFVAVCIISGALYEIIKIRDQDNRKQLKDSLHTANEYYTTQLQHLIQNDLQVLDGITVFMNDQASEQYLANVLLDEKEKHGFHEIYIIDENYKKFILKDHSFTYEETIEDSSFIQKILNGSISISRMIETDNKKEICYGVPIYNQENVVGVLVATMSVDKFESIINLPFQENTKVMLVDKSGEVLLSKGDETITNIIKDTNMREDMGDSWSINDLHNFSFHYEGVTYLANRMSANLQGWNVIVAIPTTTIDQTYLYTTFGLVSFAVLVIILFAGLLLYINHMVFKGRKEVDELAYYDSLTHAYNKNGFELKANALLSEDHGYTLVVLNIHDFKFINHSFGYDVGNQTLCYIADVLRNNLEENEIFYHREGDRFAFLIYTQEKVEIIRRVEKIMNEISNFELLQKEHYPLYAYCGIKICHMFSTEVNLEVLLDRAYMAQLEVHKLHGNGYAFYNEMMFEKAQQKNEIEQRMAQALIQKEFQIYIQPKYNLLDEKLYSGEALVRWIVKDKAIYFPDMFIPVFEQNGFIAKLDLYMFEELCIKLREWKQKGYTLYPISLNQSRLLFFQEHYVDTIKELVQRYEIDPSYIILEITEGLVTMDVEELVERIKELHALGFKISMDDFGSGYSSLNILKQLPIDELKLDRVFLMENNEQAKSQIIMKNIINMAQQLGMKTVCEGVETADHVRILQDMQCDIAQGFYYARPIPIEDFEVLAFQKDR